MAKNTQQVWFTKVRGSYLPCSWQGWLLYVPYVAFLLLTLYEATQGGRTSLGMAYFLFPQYISAVVVMNWLAERFSK
jgi:hypothetical protein